jgi:imidazolonepropionase-like amidohydrolase
METSTGSIAVGKRADFWTTDTKNAIQAIPYFFGINHALEIYISGNKS